MHQNPKFQAQIALIQTASELLHIAANTVCELGEDAVHKAGTIAEVAGEIAASSEFIRNGLSDTTPNAARDASFYAATAIDRAVGRVRPILDHQTTVALESRLEALRKTPAHQSLTGLKL